MRISTIPEPRMQPHGTRTRYATHGCRCDECREANREWSRDQRQRNGTHASRLGDGSHVARRHDDAIDALLELLYG
jgi:hypothetical protein